MPSHTTYSGGATASESDVDVADGDEILVAQGHRVMDGAAVHGRAVLRAQIFHEEVLAHQLETGVAAGHVAGADDDVSAR